MKKVFLLLSSVIFGLMACADQYGEGGKNAASFVMEQMKGDTEGAESVLPTAENMLPIVDYKGRTQQIRDSFYFHNELVTEEVVNFGEWLTAESSISEMAWKGDTSAISEIKEYGTEIRKVYTVTITMPSQKKTDIRVIMEPDGITPFMLESEYMKPQKEYRDYLMYEYSIEEVAVDATE